MNYELKPSPDYISAVKLAANLWNQPDIRDAISTFCNSSHEFEGAFLEIESAVNKKVPLHPMPGEHLREKVLDFIKPIGFQILRWIQYHCRDYLKIDLPRKFYWTSHGTIDKKRTAEVLVEDESIDITTRYKLSCIYCLENTIQRLWFQMQEDCRKGFGDQNQHKLVIIWTNIMKEQVASISPYQDAFKCASYLGNAVATEYFFHKLTSSEKRKSLIQTAATVADRCVQPSDYSYEFIKEYGSETLCFLLSKMDNEQQLELFQNAPIGVLICLLDWPWQFFFKETASVMRDFLPPVAYDILLNAIIDKVINGHKYFNYKELFGEIWQQTPNVHKKSLLNDIAYYHSLLAKLFKVKDENIIKIVLRDVTPCEKMKIIYCYTDICIDLMLDEEWVLLDYFVRECISSKDEMMKFRIRFDEIIEQTIMMCWSEAAIHDNIHKLCKCSDLLTDIFIGFDK